MKALIQNGFVVQVCETEFEVHESFTWVEAPEDCDVGWEYDGSSFTPPVVMTEEQISASDLKILRMYRNGKLADTDHWAYQDTPEMTSEQITYRQALRDITNIYSSMNDEGFVWPTKPE